MRCELCGRRVAKAKVRIVVDRELGAIYVCPNCDDSEDFNQMLYRERVRQKGGHYPGLG